MFKINQELYNYCVKIFNDVVNISKEPQETIKYIRDGIKPYYNSSFVTGIKEIDDIANKYNCFKITKECIIMRYDLHIGYFVEDGFIYIPDDMPGINHEVSHFIEMNDLTRLLKDDFGFHNIFNSKNITQKKAVSASIRETRVRAIENIIRSNFNNDKDFFIKKTKELPKWRAIVYDHYISEINFGRFKSKSEFIEYLIHTAERTFDIYNKEKILFEFENRIKYILENSK